MLRKKFFQFALILISFIGLISVNASYANTHAHENKTERVRSEAKQSTDVVNINTADAKALSTLKGIGAKKAEAILEYRKQNGPFANVEDLAKVKGIGEKGLARLQKFNPNRMTVK